MEEKSKKRKLTWIHMILIWIGVVLLVAGIIAIYTYVRRSLINYQTIPVLQKVIERATANTNDDVYLSAFSDDRFAKTIQVTLNAPSGVIGEIVNNPNYFGNSYSFTVILSGFAERSFDKDMLNWAKIVDPNATLTDALIKAVASPTGNGTFTFAKLPEPSIFASIFMPALQIMGYGISAIIMLTFLRWIMSGGSLMAGNPMGNQKSLAQKIHSTKKFTDIAGNEEAKEEVSELVDYLKNPKKYETAGARIPKGILLGGPPGTGKTLLAKATAGEANVPFFFISASNFVEMFVGLGAKRVRDMFAEARESAPAIIFIDELDAVGRARGAGIGGGNDEREQTLNQLLVEMDGMKENSGILIMAATNRTDVLDPALLRPGRFDRTITVGLPDVKEREAILKLHARGKRIDPSINFAKVSRRTPGFSGAQLENVINEASLLSVRERTKFITMAQIDEAIDRVIAGPAKKSRTISQKENERVAIHEAGHAVVCLKIKGGNKVQKITIIPRGQAGGYNLMMPEEEKYNHSKSELLAIITSFMGGRAAESIIYGDGNVSTGASDDIAKATNIARKMVTEWGLSDLGPIKYEEDSSTPFLGRDYMKNASFSNKVGQEIDDEIRKIILQAEKDAVKIIKENIELLKLIKEALIINETIVAEEIEYIEKNMALPKSLNETKEQLKEEFSEQSFNDLFDSVTENTTQNDDKKNEE
ncbi:ATP-dependent zinc metalloprotease FtsH [Mycoplasma struthionis]|uniref:ATP-dependent zinc metalloprotease FtsH n=1 Tax=Mycoplasma struthionis TaxID=538220 RepID=A0A3G8LFT7_9MOLU|nr:ATP-dependent zinc metalloprotease FtsH [Mycoplasma struthionis]AZG68486.1 ATP-dependent zinc metalloprotease FtsH [Mycoplasma struthionis]